jgi:hypothetical protein
MELYLLFHNKPSWRGAQLKKSTGDNFMRFMLPMAPNTTFLSPSQMFIYSAVILFIPLTLSYGRE